MRDFITPLTEISAVVEQEFDLVFCPWRQESSRARKESAMHAQHSITASKAASSSAGKIPDALANFNQLPDSAHVRSDAVRGLFGIRNLSTIWRWTKSGRLPKPRKLGGSTSNFWNVGDLRAALAKVVDHATS